MLEYNAHVTIDLNGYKLVLGNLWPIYIGGCGEGSGFVTIQDSSAYGSGRISNSYTRGDCIHISDQSTLTINSGTFYASSDVLYCYSGTTVTLNGGTFKGKINIWSNSILYANGGTVYETVQGNGKITCSSDATGITTFLGDVTCNDISGAQITISFDTQGGTPVSPMSALKGKFTGMSSEPTKTDTEHPNQYEYVFDGWYTAADGGTKITDFNTLNGDTTLYAHWTKTIKQEYVTSLEEQISNLKTEINTVKSDLTQAQQDLAKAQSQTTTDTTTIQNLKADLTKLNTDLTTAQAKLTDVQKQLNDALDAAADDAKTIQEQKDQIDKLQKELDESKKSLTTLQAALDDEKAKNQTAETTISDLNKQLTDAKTQLSKAEASGKADAKTIADLNAALNRLSGELTSVESSYSTSSEAYRSQIKKLNSELAQLTSQLAQVNQELSETKTTLTESQKQNGIDSETIENLNAQIDQLIIKQIKVANVRNLKTTPKTGKQVKVNWKAPKGISGLKYQVKYQKKGSKKWTTKTTSKKNLTVKKLKKNSEYRFKVRGYKKIGGKTIYTDYDTTTWVKVIK